jgi:hypothetical protein
LRHFLLVAVAALCVGAAFAGSASAAMPTACSLLRASDYKAVIGKPVKMTSGEGTASCNVFIGANPASAKVFVIPGLGHYDAGVATRLKGLLRRAPKDGGTVEKHSELGPQGAVISFGGAHPSVTSYAQKGGWAFGFQGEKGVTKAQVLALAKLAYRRL